MNKILDIKEIKFEKQIYPRQSENWQLSLRYAKAMKSGVIFPQIEVAFINKTYYLVDGFHRLQAYKTNKVKHVQVEVNKNIKTFEQAYLIAVERNCMHGQNFTFQERTIIAAKLSDMHISDKTISKLIGTPINEFKSMINTNISHSISGEIVGLKAGLEHFAGETVSEDFINTQFRMRGFRKDYTILDQVIDMLEHNMFNLKDKSIKNKFNKLMFLIKKKL